MDEFAQSREDDDLFADDFEPVPESIVAQENPKTATDLDAGSAVSGVGGSISNNQQPNGPAGHRGGRGRDERRSGRGGRSGASGGGLGSSRYAPQTTSDSDIGKPDALKPNNSTVTTVPPELPSATSTVALVPTSIQSSTTATLPLKAKSNVDSTVDNVGEHTQNPLPPQTQGPQQPSRPTAVRGDRHLTGGPAHKKLTEAELTEKMEKMKIINAQKAEKFRLSEEDSAAFARKEKEMAKKRVEEQKNARAMDMERAKNRQRKLAAQGGREWDSEKQESDIVDGRGRGRSSEYVRGGYGGFIRGGLSASRYAQAGDEEGEGVHYSSKGRGAFEIRGRGNRGGRGGSRGGKPSPATIPTPDDFPKLPTAKLSTTEVKTTSERIKSPIEKPTEDWAEEMATPVENKKIDI